ncbi:MAG: S-layer homology domain-containing protein, partial [Eggerthellaceae bacterium]|nr:S-layer homology domain-containing protein [Eggerthellaceae bacterium]
RLSGEPSSVSSSTFDDVSPDAWHADSMAWAQEAGIIRGYDDGSNEVGPNDKLTREQLAAILYRYAEWKGMDVSARADLSQFADGAEVSAWAQDAMSWAVAEGIIRGYDDGSNKIAPTSGALRAQTATMLLRFSELQGDA